ncbi:hypothetical protein PIROE2DRAFT_8046 [Piromyces sp. E2]|nr:hypothetical protein PIROE2DRAFT_8046 [Piromyces sp. E2]|eukprot:OUM65063.1 hypothetical protein PIROE2DRAFT_8046 [Piromyces sp. E2]
MSNKKSYYLIDFENVGVNGLEGAENLNLNDYVHLFSTKNAPKVTTSTLATFNSTNFKVHEVPVKNQSVDMHLVSYLGYLIGINGASSNYIIVSRDKDYLNIIKYWKKECNITVNTTTTATTNSNTTKKNKNRENDSTTPKKKENNNSNTHNKNNNNYKNNNNNNNNNNNRNNKNNKNTSEINDDIFDLYHDNNSNERTNPNSNSNSNSNSIKKKTKKIWIWDDMVEKVIAIVTKYYGRDQYLVRVTIDLQRDLHLSMEDYRKIFEETIMTYIFPNLSKISPRINSKLITEFVFYRFSSWHKELFYDLFTVIRKEMKNAGFSNNITKKVCDIIQKNTDDQYLFFLCVYSDLSDLQRRNEIYKIIGKIIIKDINPESTISTPNPLVNEIFKALSEAKYKGDVIGYVAHYVLMYNHTDDAKNTIYKLIVEMYGQKDGLSIYNCIKNII